MEIRQKKSCYLLGNNSYLVEFATTLIRKGIEIKRVFSDEQSVARWCHSNSISVIPMHMAKKYENYIGVVNYLFSIHNPVILPTMVTNLATDVALNYHNALLPNYRGVNSTSWAILNKEKYHGYTWHLINKSIDAGDIVFQEKIKILDNDTAYTLNIRLLKNARSTFPAFIDKLLNNALIKKTQILM